MKTALKHHPGSARPSTKRLASGDRNYYTLKFFATKSSITESFDFRNYFNLVSSQSARIHTCKRYLGPLKQRLQKSRDAWHQSMKCYRHPAHNTGCSPVAFLAGSGSLRMQQLRKARDEVLTTKEAAGQLRAFCLP